MVKLIKSLTMTALLVGWFFLSQYTVGILFITLGGQTFASNHQFLATLTSYILALGGPVGLDYMRKKDILRGYRHFSYQKFYKYIVYGIGLWILTTFINAIFLPFFPEYSSEIDTLFTTNEHLIRFIVLVIGAPVVEEYIFRGKIQYILKKAFGPALAVIAQGLIFGMIHPFGLQKIYASVLGIGFGWIREKNNNTMTSTIMHMTINFIGWGIGILGSYYLVR